VAPAVRRFLGQFGAIGSAQLPASQLHGRDLHVDVLDPINDLERLGSVTSTSWSSGDSVSSSFQVLVLFTRPLRSDNDVLHLDYQNKGTDITAIRQNIQCYLGAWLHKLHSKVK